MCVCVHIAKPFTKLCAIPMKKNINIFEGFCHAVVRISLHTKELYNITVVDYYTLSRTPIKPIILCLSGKEGESGVLPTRPWLGLPWVDRRPAAPYWSASVGNREEPGREEDPPRFGPPTSWPWQEPEGSWSCWASSVSSLKIVTREHNRQKIMRLSTGSYAREPPQTNKSAQNAS